MTLDGSVKHGNDAGDSITAFDCRNSIQGCKNGYKHASLRDGNTNESLIAVDSLLYTGSLFHCCKNGNRLSLLQMAQYDTGTQLEALQNCTIAEAAFRLEECKNDLLL